MAATIAAPPFELHETDTAKGFRRLLIAAVVLGILVLLGTAVATAVLVGETQDSTRWVNHTYGVEHDLSDLRVSFERTEAARRGYLITRDSDYQATYAQAANGALSLLAHVRAITGDNPRQQQAAANLQGLLAKKLAEQRASMEAAEQDVAGRLDPAMLIRQDQMEVTQIRVVLEGMAGEERRLLDLRTREQDRDSGRLLAVTLASGVMLALLAVGAFILMRRYAADLDRSRAALRRLNTGLETEVARRTADLTRANIEIQRFAYIVSHDLRSPLVNVMGFTSELELALKPLHKLLGRVESEAPALLDKDARAAIELDLPESIGFIRTSTQKMDRLINAILKLSREGGRRLTPEPLAMGAMMEQIAGALKQQTEQKGATIEIDPALPDIVGDRLATEQVFSNVVENALKYLKPGRPGVIRVRGKPVLGRMVYEVADNGRGIDAKDHERVFELFRRAGTQDQPGEGIGLAHVRALVHRLGGAIEVESALDQGATFRLSLPPTLIRSEELS